MLDPDDEASRKRIAIRQNIELSKGMRWLVAILIFPLSWLTQFILIYRHWGEMWSHLPAVFILLFLPFPCIQMFFNEESQNPFRRPISAMSALFTYLLVMMAQQVVFAYHH